MQGNRRLMAGTKQWSSYAADSEVEHFARFCREHLVQSEDRWEGRPLLLEPWQRRMLGEALAFDPEGWPTWRSVVIVAPRKQGKTAVLAALSLYRLLTSTGRPEILLAAPSDRVAGRLFDAAARFVRRSPISRNSCASAITWARSCARPAWGSSTGSRATLRGCTASTRRTSSSTSSPGGRRRTCAVRRNRWSVVRSADYRS